MKNLSLSHLHFTRSHLKRLLSRVLLCGFFLSGSAVLTQAYDFNSAIFVDGTQIVGESSLPTLDVYGDGTVLVDISQVNSNTYGVILNGANFAVTGNTDGVRFDNTGTSTILTLHGDNVIDMSACHSSASNTCYGVFSASATSLLIQGDGSLTVIGGDGAIFSAAANTTIAPGATVSITSGTSPALSVDGDLTLSGALSLTVSSGSVLSFADDKATITLTSSDAALQLVTDSGITRLDAVDTAAQAGQFLTAIDLIKLELPDSDPVQFWLENGVVKYGQAITRLDLSVADPELGATPASVATVTRVEPEGALAGPTVPILWESSDDDGTTWSSDPVTTFATGKFYRPRLADAATVNTQAVTTPFAGYYYDPAVASVYATTPSSDSSLLSTSLKLAAVAPAPSPTPTPTPSPEPSPTPESTPSADPTPESTPGADPAEPEPSPAPVPAPAPTPAPAVSSNSHSSSSSSSQSSSSSSSSSSSKSSSSSSSSSSHDTGCHDVTPSGAPDLFQINRLGTRATLYFAPVPGAHSYHVVFGRTEGEELYGGISMSADDVSGVLSLDISNLQPGQQYSFKIAPVNGCAVGEWSNWLTAKGLANSSRLTKTYRY